jgi:hypothetical protein
VVLGSLPECARCGPGGRFELIRRLGAGGMGVVWEAFDLLRGEPVALKLPPSPAANRLAMLKHEFRVLADLRHENIVRVHELLELDGAWFLSMELLEGVPLPQWVFGCRERAVDVVPVTFEGVADLTGAAATLARPAPRGEGRCACRRAPGRALSRDEADRIVVALRQVAAGLAAVHAAGTVHGDIQPTNILVTDAGRAVLVDFGMAWDSTWGDPIWRRAGAIAGTPGYLSPEQVRGERPTARSDLYALGVVLHELLTGVIPASGRAGPPSAAVCAPGAPPDLSDLCAELLQDDPARRPGAAALLARLDAAHPSRPLPGPAGSAGTPAGVAAALATVHAPRPAVVHVRGPRGSGKTESLDAHRAAVAPHGTVVLRGRCDARERVPLQALGALVDSLAAHLARLPADAAARLLPAGAGRLARRFPVLQAIEPFAAAAAQEPAADDEESVGPEDMALALEALRALFTAVAAAAPLVLELDDADACDPASAAALAELVAPQESPPVLVVLAHPADGLDPDCREALDVLDRTVGLDHVWTLDLRPSGVTFPPLRCAARGHRGGAAAGLLGGLLARLRDRLAARRRDEPRAR